MFVVPAILDDVSRDHAVLERMACFGAAMHVALTEELRRTRPELRPIPAGVRIENHRDVISLPLAVQPWYDAADLNGAGGSPEGRAESGLPGHLIDVEQIANEGMLIAGVQPAATLLNTLQVAECAEKLRLVSTEDV